MVRICDVGKRASVVSLSGSAVVGTIVRFCDVGNCASVVSLSGSAVGGTIARFRDVSMLDLLSGTSSSLLTQVNRRS